MEKNYNTTYTTIKVCQIQATTINNVPITQLNLGTVLSTVDFGTINGVRYNVPQFTPSGYMSIPNVDSKAITVNMGIGQSQYAIVGYMYNYVDNRIKITKEGETAIFSNEYFINLLNDALKLEFSSINPQECQLPIGEATQQAFIIILNEIINNLKTYINNQIVDKFTTFVSTFNAHTHNVAGVSTGGATVLSAGPTNFGPTLPTYTETSDIDTAYTYMQNDKLLISENGQINI